MSPHIILTHFRLIELHTDVISQDTNHMHLENENIYKQIYNV